MTTSLVRLLLAVSLLVGAMPWSEAAVIAATGDSGPGIVAGGPNGDIVLPAECALQPERPARKGVPGSAALPSVPPTVERPLEARSRGAHAADDRAPWPPDRPFLRPETRAPPLLAL